MNKESIATVFRLLQEKICFDLEVLDGKSTFRSDNWERLEGGGGRTNTITNGKILEKGGVAFSAVHGPVSESMMKQLGMSEGQFFATGISIVLHPFNPHNPIIHMNVRYFELDNGTYWFGGGIDLTPHYIVKEQAVLFHQRLKDICDVFDVHFYAKHKKWADNYFYIPHRGESRGVGGIFFDHLSELNSNLSKEEILNYCKMLAESFVSIYTEQVTYGMNKSYTEEQLTWRNLRRGRYVEFNLVHDRGTKFGLYSGGRTESILMSMPPLANWEYDYQPMKGSKEEQTLELLKQKIDWLIL
jgi:coproporphyrinogen III oxidase